MTDVSHLALALTAGLVLGTIFYGGLWWTVARGLKTRRPGLWFLCSLLLRSGIAIAGFYLFARGSWEQLLACLAGFTIAQLLVTQLTRAAIQPRHSQREVEHAS